MKASLTLVFAALVATSCKSEDAQISTSGKPKRESVTFVTSAPCLPASSVPRTSLPPAINSAAIADVLEALPRSSRATEHRELGARIYLSESTLQIDGEDVPREAFASTSKLLSLLAGSDKSSTNLAIEPLVAAARRSGASEVTAYVDRHVHYLVLGQVLTSLALANVSTVHLAVNVKRVGTRTFDLALRNERPGDDEPSPVASVFMTFARIHSVARTCEASTVRDPFMPPEPLKELGACAASVKEAGGTHDAIVIIPGMDETTETLVGILDAIEPSFPTLVVIPDGDILRGLAGAEELQRLHSQPKK